MANQIVTSVSIEGGARVTPGTIYCVGRNYHEHAKELQNPIPKEPVVFLKATSSLRDLGTSGIAYATETFHHEIEVVVLINDYLSARQGHLGWQDVAGLALGLDMTRREKQTALKSAGLPWALAKSFRGAAPIGPFIPLAKLPKPEQLEFALTVNGEARQRGAVRDMLFDVPTLLNFLASSNDLRPGDMIFTGTPSGVGPIRQGDKFRLAFTDTKWAFDGVL